MSWRFWRQPGVRRTPEWWLGQAWFGPAVMAGLFILLLTGLMTLIANTSESRDAMELASSIEPAATTLEQRIEANQRFLQSLANARLAPAQVAEQARAYLGEHPELDHIFHVGGDGRITWDASADPTSRLDGQPAAFLVPAAATEAIAATNRPGYTEVYQTPSGDSAFAAVVPAPGAGLLVCTYSCERLLRRTLPRQILVNYQSSLIGLEQVTIASVASGEQVDRELVADHLLSPPGNGLTLRLAQYDRPFWTFGSLALLTLCASLVVGMAWGMWSLQRQVHRREAVEADLRRARDELERRVADRTADLRQANQLLQVEMAERQRAEQRAREHHDRLAHASRVGTMGEMAAGLAHELNQPLGSIASFADGAEQLLDNGTDAKDPLIREAVKEIAGQARHAGRIIHRLREFVAQESPRRTVVTAGELISDVAELMDSDLRHGQVDLAVHVPPRLPAVLVDKIQVEQVLVNLMRNAIEAMSDSATKRLTIAAGLAGDRRASISVSDTGDGADDETIAKVFDPFFTTRAGGMGMGLSISRSIIEAHEGRLTAARNGEGGLTFRFTLPLAEGVRHAPGNRNAFAHEAGHDLRGR